MDKQAFKVALDELIAQARSEVELRDLCAVLDDALILLQAEIVRRDEDDAG